MGPETPNAPSTLIYNHFIRIQWTAPYQNSAPIIAYKVFIANAEGDFIQDLIYCDGSQEPILSNTYCEIPMSALRLNPYNLAFGQEILAKVQASNIYGDSGISDVSLIKAKIQTEPQQVQNLVKLLTTNQRNIDFQWDRLTTSVETGGTSILSYNVQWDLGTNGYTYVSRVGYSAIYDENSYSISAGIEVGKFYQVRVAAKNYWGWGPFSEVLTIKAASFPE